MVKHTTPLGVMQSINLYLIIDSSERWQQQDGCSCFGAEVLAVAGTNVVSIEVMKLWTMTDAQILTICGTNIAYMEDKDFLYQV